jgi:uncharacterized membrane protein
MALEDDLQLPSSPAGAEAEATGPALEQRVARLEREFDVLRRQIATVNVAPPPVPGPSVDVRPAPPRPAPRHSDAAAASLLLSISDLQATGLPSQRLRETGVFPPPVPPPPPVHPRSFENRLGSQIFNRIGIVLLLIGTAGFLKLAVDRRWIVPSPTGRIIVGLLAGAAIVLWSEPFRRKGFAAFSYSLKALGSGVLYLSLWAAFQIYHLLPAPAALGLMVLVTGWNAWMAWAQNSELLAAYALAGGFATPLLLSSGGNHEAFLFTYLLAIDIATVVLVRVRGWPRLLLGAFPLTMAFFIAWYVEFFAASELMLTSIFIVLFDCTFSSVPIDRNLRASANAGPRTNRSTLIEDILLPLANAAFLALALYSVLQDSGHHALLPWLMIVLAAVYLVFMRLPQSRTASAIHLSIAIVLLTIAVPLKASGYWITVSWLVEGLALLWVATRLASAAPSQELSEAYASRTLRWLASAALLLGFCGIFLHSLESGLIATVSFFNADMATALIGVAVFAATAWLARRSESAAGPDSLTWPKIAVSAFVAIDLIAVLLTLRELFVSWSPASVHPPFRSADFGTALVGLAIFAGVVAVALRLKRARQDRSFWMNYAAISTIAFNLIAVLTGVREIDAIWDLSSSSPANPEAGLQQALAISGFLMLYGAVLLAVGFWRRSAFLRWQALLLLVFTIFKTFLYDMRNLSQGYRVASFLGLGALLMAISFAYQKDWLNLREPEPAESSEGAR